MHTHLYIITSPDLRIETLINKLMIQSSSLSIQCFVGHVLSDVCLTNCLAVLETTDYSVFLIKTEFTADVTGQEGKPTSS
jgi:hypothetical protein